MTTTLFSILGACIVAWLLHGWVRGYRLAVLHNMPWGLAIGHALFGWTVVRYRWVDSSVERRVRYKDWQKLTGAWVPYIIVDNNEIRIARSEVPSRCTELLGAIEWFSEEE